jgi:hypothetical protein
MVDDARAEPLYARVSTTARYRDELNFAEFPIAAVADVVPAGQKTLEFTDEIFDQSSGRPVTRTLTITAADRFGLPTALDDEVLLGLVQLTSEQQFADRRVHFSRYGLIKLLGWRDESKSYKRVEDSLNRWAGVTLQYRKAWWSKEEGCWVNETFHVLDQVTVFDRERLDRRRQMAKGQPDKALSSFLWSEAVFQSFRAGYLKSLDFDFYKGLGSAVAKRMYRFLDKRFYHRGRWEFDLRAFACEHVGLSKNYSNSELKRKLLPAVRELEGRGFLTPMPDEERFRRVERGNWRAVFVKAQPRLRTLPGEAPEGDTLLRELVARGITRRSAQKLLAHHPRAKIEEKVRLFDWLKTTGGAGAIRNRAGWLYAAIVNDYAVPPEETPGRPNDGGGRGVPETTPAAAPPQDVPDEAARAFESFWAALAGAEREEFERQAAARASPFLQRHYHAGPAGSGSLWAATRQRVLLDQFARTRPPAGTPDGRPAAGAGEGGSSGPAAIDARQAGDTGRPTRGRPQ